MGMVEKNCNICIDMIECRLWNNRVAGWLTSIPYRMEVVLMDRKPFDFKDLMAFGMFMLALLTFIVLICK